MFYLIRKNYFSNIKIRMKGHKKVIFSRNASFSVIISIALVIYTLGIIGFLMMNAKTLSDYFKENIAITLILHENIKEPEIIQLTKSLQGSPYVKSVTFIHPDSAAKKLARDLGEDFITFLGYNPLLPSFELKLNAAYANPDSLSVIEQQLNKESKIKEIFYEKNLLTTVHQNIKKISSFLLFFSVLMFIISFALIDSSIRLSIYAKRFLIRTMQLVGATPGFIRRPFIYKGILHGFMGAVIAIGLFSLSLYYVNKYFPELLNSTPREYFLLLFAGKIIVGIFISWVSTIFAIRKYLRLKTSDLYF